MNELICDMLGEGGKEFFLFKMDIILIKALSKSILSTHIFPSGEYKTLNTHFSYIKGVTLWVYKHNNNKINNNLRFFVTRNLQPTGLSRRCCVTAAAYTLVIKPMAAKQACTHNVRPETIDQKYGRILIFRCRRKPEYPEKTYHGGYGIGKPKSHTTTG